MRKYETVFIIRPDMDEAATNAVIEKITSVITENGGTLDNSNIWGLRKLAYLIEDYAEGFYVVFNFSSELNVIDALEYNFKVSDSILRHIIVRDGE